MKIQFSKVIYRGFWAALDWIYPPVCAGCGEPGYRLCASCQAKIKWITGKKCRVCGEPMIKQQGLCDNCRLRQPSFTAMRNLAEYEGVMRECIHGLKYENNQSLGDFFAEWLETLVRKEAWSIDMVIPVPLSRQRLAERGYNQAAMLAKPLALQLGCAYNPFGLKRIRDTRSQVGLSGEERRRNVVGAFEAVPQIVHDKAVLVVDDVMTTGATMESCGQALFDAGAIAVFCLTLARYSPRNHSSLSTRHQV